MQQEQESAKLCVNGCGFFGSPATSDMCSVCWKKTMSRRQMETMPRSPSKRSKNSAESVSTEIVETTFETLEQIPCEEGVLGETNTVSSDIVKLVQKNKNRCWECKKKVGLAAMECRCGYVFCNSHRYADQHQCSFDYKAADRAELARRNPGGGQFVKFEKL
ncbi:hypothetical protein ABG067_005520 [Albugo candida]|uniref:AN1-type domain-containing protein n=1 Tax=Albugo candida TaxID=65357 RepID=A0A024FVU3_9STRA|nr:unnamed protein product [Albugo candida]|eukprot:CCI10992.1 unnamed protein product [Albugo candida]